MHRFLKFIAVIAIVIGLESCASSTKITNSWRDPALTAADLHFQKVLALAIVKDEATRRAAEEEMVRQIGPNKSVAAHNILSGDDLKDVEKVKAKVTAEGFDGAVTMRLVGSEQQVTWVPGSYPNNYYSFYGYYGYAYPAVYDPGYMRTDVVVKVETNIYSVKDAKLVWTSLSESFNPDNAAQLVSEIADAVVYEMQDQGLIQKQK